MTDKTRSLRLDEILLRDGLVTEAQLSAALQRQKLYGGRLGTQLLQMKIIDEITLVRILADKLSCEGIVLSDLEISEAVINMVPATVAVARKVIPFLYDHDRNLLKIACEDPTNSDLISELKFVSAGKTIKLYVASELALNRAIAKHYLGKDQGFTGDDKPGLPEMTLPGGMNFPPSDQTIVSNGMIKGAVLLVTDDETSGAQLQMVFERDQFRVIRTDSADEAIQIIGNQKFHSVFIQDTVPGDYIDLIDRLRKISPKTRVKYFESVSSLLLNLDAGVMESDLVTRNLELFTSLLSSSLDNPDNHSARVGKYVDRICRRLELADKDRLVITNAAYLHDLSRYYYGKQEPIGSHRQVIILTVKLFESLSYSPLVIEVLRSMYINLREKFTKRLPIEVLGGNILTVADIFCETVDPHTHLSLDRFDAIKKKYRELIGKLFLSEVVEAFVAMIQEEILSITTLARYSQVLLYGSNRERLAEIEQRIKGAGFRTVSEMELTAFIDLCKRSRPDIIVLEESESAETATHLVDTLIQRGVGLDRAPTFLLTSGGLATQMSSLLERGIEDVLPADDNLNVLLIKMKKVQARIEQLAKEREDIVQQPGAMGQLTDINLIDLLQAIGPSGKTAKLMVSSESHKLTVFLSQGNIVFADADGITGPEAVYDALGWSKGTWKIQTITHESLPEPNTFAPNESILMEGCRLMDERVRSHTS